jgi:hypothetical protein
MKNNSDQRVANLIGQLQMRVREDRTTTHLPGSSSDGGYESGDAF